MPTPMVITHHPLYPGVCYFNYILLLNGPIPPSQMKNLADKRAYCPEGKGKLNSLLK